MDEKREAQAGEEEAGAAGSGKRGEDAPRRNRNKTILLAVGAAVLAVLIVGAFFALGYCVGGHSGRPERPALGGKIREKVQSRLQARRENARGFVEDQGTDIFKGSVTSVEGSKVTVETPHGTETFVVSDATRYPGAGPGGETGVKNSGAAELTPGKNITAMVKKGADGSWEALVVRAPGEGGKR
jgi:hypothetical protein